MTTVSAIIPAYNAADVVARAIDSALAQTHRPIEILVIDDGSTDGTADRVAAYGPPVRLLRQANGGPASARNRGALAASGEWLALLDADDWWFPAKLERQLALIAVQSAAEAPTAQRIGVVHARDDDYFDPVPDRLGFDDLWARNPIMTSSVLIRRDAFAAMGGFDEARDLISVEDYNLWLRMAWAGWAILTCQDVLAHYTRGDGLSSNAERFLAASLFNLDRLAAVLPIAPAGLRRKRAAIHASFGRWALAHRRMKLARRMFARAVMQAPTVPHLIGAAAACLPAAALEARHRVLERLRRAGAGRAVTLGADAPADHVPADHVPADRVPACRSGA